MGQWSQSSSGRRNPMIRPSCLVATLFISMSVSCSGSGGSEPTKGYPLSCPNTLLTARFLAGSVTFAIASAAPETHPLSPNDDPAPLAASGKCAGANVVTFVTPEYPNNITEGEVHIMCEPSDGTLSMAMRLPDRRVMSLGTHILLGQMPTLWFATPSCAIAQSDGSAIVEVTRAEGGSAPYPAAVTADYVREFAVHIEARADQMADSCRTPAIATTVDLQFSE